MSATPRWYAYKGKKLEVPPNVAETKKTITAGPNADFSYNASRREGVFCG